MGDELLGASPFKAFGKYAEAAAALQMRQGHILAYALTENEALSTTIFRNKHKPKLNGAPRTGVRIGFAAKAYGPGRQPVGAENGASEFGASAADQADQADYLPRLYAQRYVAQFRIGRKAFHDKE